MANKFYIIYRYTKDSSKFDNRNLEIEADGLEVIPGSPSVAVFYNQQVTRDPYNGKVLNDKRVFVEAISMAGIERITKTKPEDFASRLTALDLG